MTVPKLNPGGWLSSNLAVGADILLAVAGRTLHLRLERSTGQRVKVIFDLPADCEVAFSPQALENLLAKREGA